MKKLAIWSVGCALGVGLLSGGAMAAEATRYFEVTITNVTRGQTFTPVLVATHKWGVSLFDLGAPASAELSALAEGGDTMPLGSLLQSMPRVSHVTNSGGLLPPGESVKVKIAADYGVTRLSLASMLIPTNDAFFSLNNVALPAGAGARTYYSPAYDAGTEPNDELCANIPGPVCGGEGGSPMAGGEGYVHVHAGIHGIGDLNAAQYDWRNPVARISIRRVAN